MKKVLPFLAIIILAAAIFWLFKDGKQAEEMQTSDPQANESLVNESEAEGSQENVIDSYEACIAAGFPVLESDPEQCAVSDGQIFMRDTTEVVVDNGGIEEVDAPAVNVCTEAGGTWLAGINECEYVDESWCVANGGTFSACESACRNDLEAEFCTMQCVPVCYL